jgi:hypothetical protein
MYINQIDNLFDGILNKFYIFLIKKKTFERFTEEENFVKYMNDIIDIIKLFINELNINEIENLITSKSHKNYIIDIIKRYCAFYIYLGIAYHYRESRDLFITNIIETSKNVKDSTFNINNFYNSENNAKIITMFSIIKDIIKLTEFKTIDRIKIILSNEPVKYEKTVQLLNSIGEDYFVEYFMVKDNFHNILKTLIFKQIYLLEEKNEIVKLLESAEIDNAEYKYIDIVLSNADKIIDFSFLQNIVKETSELFRSNLANEYYDFLEENKKQQELNIIGNTKMIDFLFSNKIFIPITEDFLRYHKLTEKYDKDITGELKDRDATKIKYIINKINKVINMYSSMYEKNQKLKLEAMNLFFKSLEYKDAVLYNDLEEIKIINKLNFSENTTDLDYLVDLENMRKYAYLNYKDFSRDGIKLRSTVPSLSVRNSNIKHKNPKNRPLELRMGHKDLPLHVIGVIYNPNLNINLYDITTEQLKDIRTIHKNGYSAIYNLMKEPKNDNVYYWLFDTKLDKVVLSEYKNISSLENYKIIENMFGELFNNYLDISRNNLYNELKKNKYNDIYSILKAINDYQNNYKFTQNIPLKFEYEIFNKYFSQFKDIKVKVKEPVDKILIKIPESKLIKKKDTVYILGYTPPEIDIQNIANQPICHHYIKWIQLSKISRKQDELLNQAVFDFVKQYVKTNEKGDYICKSCFEMLDLKKYVYEGTYVPELDTFLTTNLAVSQKLETLPKYEKYTRTIRNIEKNIEKICYMMNLNYYIGNTPTIKLRRKLIIKDVIDIILIHTAYLKNLPKDRIEKAVEIYNINKDLTNLFWFELKDDIFLTSSMDTDYYKLIKYNNILAYILLLLICDINVGMILSFKDDKICNFFIFSQIKDSVFSKLFIRINEKEKISISSIPLLAYTLFYMACILTNNYIWLWPKNDKSQIINVQKVIINTMVDLINTMIEANMSTDKNFQYELIVNRFMQKIKTVYMDSIAYKHLEETIKEKIHIDEKNKYSFIGRREQIIELTKQIGEKNFVPLTLDPQACLSKQDKLEIIKHTPMDFDINIFTNCPDGKFHEWVSNNNTIKCSLCNTNYNDIVEDNLKDNLNISRVNQLKLLYLRKLANTYCISGETHDIDINTNKCRKCKINVSTYEYSNDELFKLDKQLRKTSDIKAIKNIDIIKKYFEKQEEKRQHDMKVMVTLTERYKKFTGNKLINYIDDFIDSIIKIVGNKIKSHNSTLYLKDTLYIIKNDYLGNPIKNNIFVLSSEDKIFSKINHFYYKRNVLYYHDKIHSAYVYYDAITKNYLGYSRDNKKFEKFKSTMNIEIVYGIRDMLIQMGLENEYININNLYTKKELKNKIKHEDIIKQLIRNRTNNLRQIIQRTNSIIERINNSSPIKESPYNIEENKLVNEFKKNLKQFKTTDNDNQSPIFKHLFTITNNINVKEIDSIELEIVNEMIDTNILSKINNTDSYLIFYYIYNMSKLIEYNTQPAIKTQITYMLIRIIQFSYNMYFVPIEYTAIRRFSSILSIDAPYIDESSRVIGFYQELVNTKEIDEEAIKEREYDMNEEQNALDIDEYDEDDVYEDLDPSDDVVSNLIGE